MRLCQIYFHIKANFPFISFNTTYLTINNNFLFNTFFFLPLK